MTSSSYTSPSYRPGMNYLHGHNGVEEDHKEAARLLAKAAWEGCAKSQKHLSALYQMGMGIPESPYKEKARYTEAYIWSYLAVKNGYLEARWDPPEAFKVDITTAQEEAERRHEKIQATRRDAND